MLDSEKLSDFFAGTSLLSRLCTQNGFPDGETLRFEVLDAGDGEVLCSVTFEEVVMEGAGCAADRVTCWGRVRVEIDKQGDVRAARIEAGEPHGS
jgi:hypothetical protein